MSTEESWIEASVSLPEDVDLHARPAAELVRAAAKFDATVYVGTDKGEADAKSLLAILALGARRGTDLKIRTKGPDADDALNSISELIPNFVDDHAGG